MKIELLHFLSTEAFDGAAHDEMRIEDARDGHPDSRYHFNNAAVDFRVQPQAAVFWRNGGTEKPQFGEPVGNFVRIFIGGFKAADVRANVSFQKFSDTLKYQSVLGRRGAFPGAHSEVSIPPCRLRQNRAWGSAWCARS